MAIPIDDSDHYYPIPPVLTPAEARRDLKPATPGPFDEKPPMHSLPVRELAALARVLEYGNRKYARDNWIGTANDPDRYIGAILRHLSAIRAGEYIDPESGLPHSAHLQASALILGHALGDNTRVPVKP